MRGEFQASDGIHYRFTQVRYPWGRTAYGGGEYLIFLILVDTTEFLLTSQRSASDLQNLP